MSLKVDLEYNAIVSLRDDNIINSISGECVERDTKDIISLIFILAQ